MSREAHRKTPPTERTRKAWAQDFHRRAQAHWTAKRMQEVFGKKHLTLPPNECGPLLRAMGLMKRDASMPPRSIHKYMQICHMVALLEPLLRDLMRRHSVVRLVDLGCGSSYLTLLLGWCFKTRWHHPAEILGVDRRRDVVEAGEQRLQMVQLGEMVRLIQARIDQLHLPEVWSRAFGTASHNGEERDVFEIHGLFALHACDTASCDALAAGVTLNAELIAVAPCCQAELASAWAQLSEGAEPQAVFAPIWRAPHLRREVGATMTDALRTLLVRGCGYTVTPMEFVPSTHTPKNTLLRATKPSTSSTDGYRPETGGAPFEEYLRLRKLLGGVSIHLERVLPSPHRERFLELHHRTVCSPGE